MTEFAARTLEIFHPDLRALPEAVFCHVVACLPDEALAEQPPVVALLRWRLREGDTLEQALARAEEVDRYAATVATYLGLASSGVADYLSTLSTWETSGEKVAHLFTRQSIPMVWDFAEAEPGRVFAHKIESVARVLEKLPVDQPAGIVRHGLAQNPKPLTTHSVRSKAGPGSSPRHSSPPLHACSAPRTRLIALGAPPITP